MKKTYWRAAHLDTMDLLPENLVRGRAYFIDDEQVIVIDHGNGPVIYGGKPGPQGEAGEPIPQLQSQIDDLAEASQRTSETIFATWETTLQKIGVLIDTDTQLYQGISNTNAELAHHVQVLTSTDATQQGQIDSLNAGLTETNETSALRWQTTQETFTVLHDTDARHDKYLDTLDESLSETQAIQRSDEDTATRLQTQIDNLAEASQKMSATILANWLQVLKKVQALNDADAQINGRIDATNASLVQTATELASTDAQHDEHLTAIDAKLLTTDKDIAHTEMMIEDSADKLQSQIDNLTRAVVSLTSTITAKFDVYDKALAIIAKAISNLYPDFEWPYKTEESESDN